MEINFQTDAGKFAVIFAVNVVFSTNIAIGLLWMIVELDLETLEPENEMYVNVVFFKF